ncbi:NmrA-like family domain-containing protein, partial [Lachnellula suecica]
MSKILAVFGATGNQGSSIITHVLASPTLSSTYTIRAITRDITASKSKQLAHIQNIDVVKADAANRASLETALTGVHTVFIMTTPFEGPDAEFTTAKTIADVAVEKGAQYIIFSTLPAVSELSGGKYSHVTPFDAKAKAENYIRGLPIKSAFYSGGFFMENFQTQPFLLPKKAEDGTWVLARPCSGKTLGPYVDAVRDTGKFVGAILAEPDKYAGKTFCGAAAQYNYEDIARILSKKTQKKVVFKQISMEEFGKGIPWMQEVFVDALGFQAEYGYF